MSITQKSGERAIFQGGLKQCGFNGEVEIEVHDRKLIIKSISHSRQSWKKALKATAQNEDDQKKSKTH